MLANIDSIPPKGGCTAAVELATAQKLKHLAKQPAAAAWQSFTASSAGIPSQHSCVAVISCDAVSWSLGIEKVPAIGTVASDSAIRKVNMVRQKRMAGRNIRLAARLVK